MKLSLPSAATSIKWYKDGVLVADSTATTFTTGVVGTYNATYIEDPVSCDIVQSDYFLLVNGGSTITLDGQVNNGGGTGYQWTNGGVDISGANSASYTTSTGGLFTLKYNNGTCDLTTTPYYVYVLLPNCSAGTVAPIIATTTKANVCPATTVDLTSITASNLPASTTLTWHTGTPATTANKVTGTALAAGTYYAAFFDATNNCYSATTVVTATVASCICNTTPIIIKN